MPITCCANLPGYLKERQPKPEEEARAVFEQLLRLGIEGELEHFVRTPQGLRQWRWIDIWIPSEKLGVEVSGRGPDLTKDQDIRAVIPGFQTLYFPNWRVKRDGHISCWGYIVANSIENWLIDNQSRNEPFYDDSP